MLNIIISEVPIDEELKTRIEFICDFCNIKSTIINGSIRRIEKTNINYIEPNKIIIKDTTFLAFNHGKDIFIENLQKHIKISEFQEYIKSLWTIDIIFKSDIINNQWKRYSLEREVHLW